jgi:tRNA threonylcarbamoyladenosine biosynthesis protein TsaB
MIRAFLPLPAPALAESVLILNNETNKKTKALAIESATNTLEICAINGNNSASLSLNCGLHMAENLLAAVERVLEHVALSAEELNFIAVNKGPGSFTSLRLGFSLAKGLSFAAHVPVYAIPATHVYAYPFNNFKAAVIPAIDAKRGRFYASLFRGGKEVVPVGDYTAEHIVTFFDAEEPVLLAGPDASLLKEHILLVNPLATLFTLESPVSTGCALFALAQKSINNANPPLTAEEGPLYIRLSEAEENYK